MLLDREDCLMDSEKRKKVLKEVLKTLGVILALFVRTHCAVTRLCCDR